MGYDYTCRSTLLAHETEWMVELGKDRLDQPIGRTNRYLGREQHSHIHIWLANFNLDLMEFQPTALQHAVLHHGITSIQTQDMRPPFLQLTHFLRKSLVSLLPRTALASTHPASTYQILVTQTMAEKLIPACDLIHTNWYTDYIYYL